MNVPTPARKSLLPLGLLAAALALTAAQCEHKIDFPGFVAENCSDNVDNDEDGKADCNDTDCEEDCRVEVTIDQPTATITTDSLRLTGTHFNATTVAVSMSPGGTGGNAQKVGGDRWEYLVTNIGTSGTYKATVVASGAGTRRDTAVVTFQKQ